MTIFQSRLHTIRIASNREYEIFNHVRKRRQIELAQEEEQTNIEIIQLIKSV